MFSFASTGSLSGLDLGHGGEGGSGIDDGKYSTHDSDIGYEDGDGDGHGHGDGDDQTSNIPSGVELTVTISTNPLDSAGLMESKEQRLSRYTARLDAILVRHSAQPIFINTLDIYMNTLETVVERSMNEQLAREEQRALFEKLKNAFITEYLKTCPYYYLPDVKLFIEYQCETFGVVQESRIWSDIITSIEADEALVPYKYRIRTEILQQIRQRHIWRCTPESSTIQGVLNLMTSFFFPNKEVAKYFLTILGDDLLGKTSTKQTIYLNTGHIDSLISTLSYQFSRYVRHKIHNIFKKNIQLSQVSGGGTPNHSVSPLLTEGMTESTHPCPTDDSAFSESAHSGSQAQMDFIPAGISTSASQEISYPLMNLRILQTKTEIPPIDFWEDHIRTKVLDIISVVFHYSIRFENAENFLETYCSLPSVYNSANMLTEYSVKSLIYQFLREGSGIGMGTIKTSDTSVNSVTSVLTESLTEGASDGFIATPPPTLAPTIIPPLPTITSTDLSYLWKTFISQYGVVDTFIMRPAIKQIQEYIAGNPSVTTHLIKRLQLPRLFKEFISTTMTPYADEEYELKPQFQYSDVYVYDTDELLKIFKMWTQLNHPDNMGDVNREIGADQILKMVTHYYNSAVRIVDGKTVYGWRCSMWDKPAMIIEYLKTEGRPHKYTDFCKFLKEKQITLIPSKAYYDRMAEN